MRRPTGSARRWRGWARANGRARRVGASIVSGCDRSFDKAAFSSDAGEARLKGVRRRATLDGFGSSAGRCWQRRRADRLSRSCRAGQVAALLPPVARDGQRIWRWTRRPAPASRSCNQQGSRAGSLIAQHRPLRDRRGRTPAGRRSCGAADATSRAIEARLAIWCNGCMTIRCCARTCAPCCARLPDVGRALGRIVAGRGSPRDLGQLRDGLGEARICATMLAAAPINARSCWIELLPALGGTARWSISMPRAGALAADRARPGRLHRRGLRRTRSTSCARPPGNARRAIAALEAKYRDEHRHRRAQDPAQRRARLFHRGSRQAMPTR
jgi:DNA mismatch repair protein MutS